MKTTLRISDGVTGFWIGTFPTTELAEEYMRERATGPEIKAEHQTQKRGCPGAEARAAAEHEVADERGYGMKTRARFENIERRTKDAEARLAEVERRLDVCPICLGKNEVLFIGEKIPCPRCARLRAAKGNDDRGGWGKEL